MFQATGNLWRFRVKRIASITLSTKAQAIFREFEKIDERLQLFRFMRLAIFGDFELIE